MGSNIPVSNSNEEIEGLVSQGSKRFKRPELLTLLEHNRLRNIGMYLYCKTDKLLKFGKVNNRWEFFFPYSHLPSKIGDAIGRCLACGQRSRSKDILFGEC